MSDELEIWMRRERQKELTGEPIVLVPVFPSWCELCCDGRVPCVCGKPAFDWQEEV